MKHEPRRRACDRSEFAVLALDVVCSDRPSATMTERVNRLPGRIGTPQRGAHAAARGSGKEERTAASVEYSAGSHPWDGPSVVR